MCCIKWSNMDLSHSLAQGSRRSSPQRALRPSAWLVGKQCIYLPIYGLRLGSGQSKRQVPEHVFKMFWKDFDKDGRGSVCLSDQVELPGSINSPSCSMARIVRKVRLRAQTSISRLHMTSHLSPLGAPRPNQNHLQLQRLSFSSCYFLRTFTDFCKWYLKILSGSIWFWK